MNAVQRDQCFGRRLARAGAARMVISRDADRVPTPTERVMLWRWRSGNAGLGNVVFLRNNGAAADAARQPPPAGVSHNAEPAGVSVAGNPFIGDWPDPEDAIAH